MLAVVIFESSTSMSHFRNKHKYVATKNENVLKTLFKSNEQFIRPMVVIAITFAILFAITVGFLYSSVEEKATLYIIAENVGAIGSLVYANYVETKTSRQTR